MAHNKTSNNLQLTHEIVSLIFSDVKKSFLAAIAVAAILLMGLTQFIQLTQGYAWLTVLALTYMVRLVLASQYKKDSQQSDNAAVWLYRFRLSIALSGLAWGFAALVIFPTNNLQYQAFFALVLAGIAAGGLISFYIDEVSSVLFVSSIMLPMGYALMSDVNPFAKDIFLLAVLFLVYVALASKRMASGLLSNIDLRVQAEKQQNEIHELSVRQKLHLEHTPMGVIEWDEHLNVVTWNKACSDIYVKRRLVSILVTLCQKCTINPINTSFIFYLKNKSRKQILKKKRIKMAILFIANGLIPCLKMMRAQ